MTDHQNYLHLKSEHQNALKNGLTYSKALHIKHICSTAAEYKKDSTAIETEGYQCDNVRENLRKPQKKKVKKT